MTKTEAGQIRHHITAYENAIKAAERHGCPPGVPVIIHYAMLHMLAAEIRQLRALLEGA